MRGSGRLEHWGWRLFIVSLGLALATAVAGLAGMTLPGVGYLVALGLMTWALFLQIRHERRLCEWCVEEFPLDAPAEAARRARSLRAFHLMAPWRMAALGLLLVGQGLSIPFSDAIGRLAFGAFVSWLMVVAVLVERHQRLRPWCPWCGPGDDGDDGEAEPEGPPSGGKSLRPVLAAG